MSFNSFNTVFSNIKLSNNYTDNNQIIQQYTYSIDKSLVYYYPFYSNISKNDTLYTPNYASGPPSIYSEMTGVITNEVNTYITGLAGLYLNNTPGGICTNSVNINQLFNLNPSGGLSISFWFSCSQPTLGTLETFCSFYLNPITNLEISFYVSRDFTWFSSGLVVYGYNITGLMRNYLVMKNTIQQNGTEYASFFVYDSKNNATYQSSIITAVTSQTVKNYTAIAFFRHFPFYAKMIVLVSRIRN